jgi:hypothetical protein
MKPISASWFPTIPHKDEKPRPVQVLKFRRAKYGVLYAVVLFTDTGKFSEVQMDELTYTTYES